MSDQPQQPSNTPPPLSPWFWEQKAYLAPDGRQLLERIVHGEPPADLDFPRFIGCGVVQVTCSNGMQAQAQVEFSIKANSPEGAMANYEAAWNAVKDAEADKLRVQAEKQIKQQMTPKLAIPGGPVPSPGARRNGRLRGM